MIVDYSADKNGSIYVANGSANHIIQYKSDHLTIISFMDAGVFSPYTFQRMTIDTNGTDYTCEYRTSYSSYSYSYSTYYRIQRYDSTNTIFVTTLFGETICGTPPNQFCGCNDMFIDQRNLICCSDSLNHIVINITTINPQVTVVAGITNTPRSQLNQLNGPQDIFVDTTGILFVFDSGNK
ncbi:unnamed protein product [Rotaria magnacalcarata]